MGRHVLPLSAGPAAPDPSSVKTCGPDVARVRTMADTPGISVRCRPRYRSLPHRRGQSPWPGASMPIDQDTGAG